MDDPKLKRRTVLERGLTGIAAAALARAAGAGRSVHAADVVSDPVPPIVPSGKRVELVDFCAPPTQASAPPKALLNFLFHAGDGKARVLANDCRGKLWSIDRTTGEATLFLDLALWRAGALLIPGSRSLGLRSFAFHPNFSRKGKAGYRRFYTMSAETLAGRKPGVPVLGGSFTPIHDYVLAEWAVDAVDPATVLRGSRREVLRVAYPRYDHGSDQIMFNPAEPGMLYIGTGDGSNSPFDTDPFNVAQDPRSALGKILRINPLRHPDGRRYRVPATNPFVGRSGYLPEIWALGLRHPLNFCFDGASGKMLIADIGQGMVEEVNLGVRGANYGWPHREGTFATERTNASIIYTLPPGDAALGYTYPVAQYDHGESNALGQAAVTGGFVYRGASIPGLVGEYLLGDILTGRIFHVPVADLQLGRQTTLKELTLEKNGVPVTLMALAGVKNRVDLRFGQDELGEIYVMSKQDGKIRKLGPALL